MKKQQKSSKLIAVIGIVGVIFLIALFATKLLAPTTPTLGASSTYGILSSTYTNTSAATTVSGDIGFTTPPAGAPLSTHTNYGSGAPYSSAGTDQASALTLLNSQPCDFTFGAATDLSLLTQPLTAGVYCISVPPSIGTSGITLLSGTYIFRSTGALNTVANSKVMGGNSCDVFWTPVATTLGANSLFVGTDIDPSGITVGSTVSWEGRALAFGGTVTTDTDTIVVPSCSGVVSIEVPVVTATTTPVVVATTTVETATTTTVVATTTVPVVVATTTPITTANTTVPKFPKTGYPPR